MTLYAEFLPDAKEMIADFGVAGSADSGALTFKCLLSDPAVTQTFEAGGFVTQTQHSVRLAASDASWTLPDGSNGASGAVVSGGSVVASLGLGKKLVAGGKNLRVTGQTYKPGSAWVTLQVVDDDQ
ncbi:MAG: hypothetical protein ACO3ND_09610 [Opitutales bacterium]